MSIFATYLSNISFLALPWNVHELMINAFGTAAILFTGLLLSLLLNRPKTHR